MKRLLSMLAILALCTPLALTQSPPGPPAPTPAPAPVPAVPFVELPGAISAEPGEWIIVAPLKKDGGEVKWKIDQGLQPVPIDKLFPGQRAAGPVVKGKVGVYTISAWCAKGDVASDLATVVITIGTPEPPAPPTPPDPPAPPDDPEAVPSSALKKAIQEAYSAETDPLKASRVAAIAKFLVPAVRTMKVAKKTVVVNGKSTQVPAVSTAKDFVDLLHQAEDLNPDIGRLEDSAVQTVRTAIGAFISTVLPRDAGSVVDDAFWRKATTAYSQVSQALKAVK